MGTIPDWALWFLYFLVLFATLFVISNMWNMKKRSWIYKGDTGPMGPMGVQGPAGKCDCIICQGKPLLISDGNGRYRFDPVNLDKPMTKD